MKNLKGILRKQSWSNFKALPRHLPGGTEEVYEKPQSGLPVSGPRFEPGTSRIQTGVLTTRPRRLLKLLVYRILK
jgi:hypothetical protein